MILRVRGGNIRMRVGFEGIESIRCGRTWLSSRILGGWGWGGGGGGRFINYGTMFQTSQIKHSNGSIRSNGCEDMNPSHCPTNVVNFLVMGDELSFDLLCRQIPNWTSGIKGGSDNEGWIDSIPIKGSEWGAKVFFALRIIWWMRFDMLIKNNQIFGEVIGKFTEGIVKWVVLFLRDWASETEGRKDKDWVSNITGPILLKLAKEARRLICCGCPNCPKLETEARLWESRSFVESWESELSEEWNDWGGEVKQEVEWDEDGTISQILSKSPEVANKLGVGVYQFGT